MGVHGLWELLSPVGHRVSNEHVRNKVLAVDISIWLTQFVKAMRDAEGAQVRNAHLLGVFRRCVKLLFLSVRPVLVFDGATPALKRRTLASRRAQRDRHAAKLRRLAEKLLVNQMQRHVVGAEIERRTASRPPLPPAPAPIRSKVDNERDDHADDFDEEDRIEPVAPSNLPARSKSGKKRPWLQTLEDTEKPDDVAKPGMNEVDRIQPMSQEVAPLAKNRIAESADPTKDDELFAADLADEEEVLSRDRDLGQISLPDDLSQIDSDSVVSLPPDVQSEVLRQIKLHQRARHRERMMRQQRNPAEFSQTQIEGFLQFTALNRKISSVRNAINSKSGASQRIASDSARQFVLQERATKHAGMGDDSSSDDDDIFSKRSRKKAEGRVGPTDILARIRASRDSSRRDEEARNERIQETERIKTESRSGVGWASRVLEGHGGLTLGGKSALQDSGSDSDDSPYLIKMQAEKGNSLSRKRDNTTENCILSSSDEVDDDEWVDVVDSDTDEDLPVAPSATEHTEVEPLSGFGKSLKYSALERPVKKGQPDGGVNGKEHNERTCAVPAAGVDVKSDENKTHGADANSIVAEGSMGPKTASQMLTSDPTNLILENKCIETVLNKQDNPKDVDVAKKTQLEIASNLCHHTPDRKGERERRDIRPRELPRVNRSFASAEPGKGNGEFQRNNIEIRRRCDPGNVIIEKESLNDKPITTAETGSDSVEQNDRPLSNHLLQSRGRHVEQLGDEEDRDIQVAIALSLNCDDSTIGKDVTQDPSIGNEKHRAKSPSRIPPRIETIAERQISEIGQSRTESEKSALLTQHQVSPVQKSNAEARSTEDIPRNSIEENEIDGMDTSESRHFEAEEMSTERMKELQDELQIEEREIRQQKNSQQGAAESVSDEMYAETRDLLKLFGIPYLEAPTEAEAQCAFLNMERIVDGVITEDSDTFLFGANVVYRRLFSEGKFAEAYEACDIKKNLGLDREQLIRLAYLLGSDYTHGVRGVGVVNSMEVLEAFPGEHGLEEFREWMKRVNMFDKEPDESVLRGISQDAVRRRFCWKHRNMKRNWEMREGFPNSAVADAYRNPNVDKSLEKFKWGKVDFTKLAQFCWEKFGWEQDRFEDAIGPLKKKLQEDSGLQQRTIDEFFKPHRFAKIRSERLQTAVRGIAGEEAKELMATLGPKIKKRKAVPISHIPSVPSEKEEEEAMVEALEIVEKHRGL